MDISKDKCEVVLKNGYSTPEKSVLVTGLNSKTNSPPKSPSVRNAANNEVSASARRKKCLYLQDLLKDRAQLENLPPGIFIRLNTVLDKEIEVLRKEWEFNKKTILYCM